MFPATIHNRIEHTAAAVAEKPAKVLPSGRSMLSAPKTIVTGPLFYLVNFLMGMNLLWLALLKYKNPIRAFRVSFSVIRGRDKEKITYRKMARSGRRFFINLNAPGWPSSAFNRCMQHALDLETNPDKVSLFALVLSVTNKCGFHCEHCFEWEKLNRKDQLSSEDITEIIKRFHELGISQLQFSGGEPFLRLPVILQALDHLPRGIDTWVYTSGYPVTDAAAKTLKQHGLTGVIISLDHHVPELHDRFRGKQGSWQKAMEAAAHVVTNGLSLAFSCCATNEFISPENLGSYLTLCRDAGASFVQFMEPEAAGNYRGKNVWLTRANKALLEQAFDRFNFEKKYNDFPVITYPKMVSRRDHCPFSGYHAVYVDADGMLQACPFCKRKSGAATGPGLKEKIQSLKQKGCSLPDFTGGMEYPLKTYVRPGSATPQKAFA